jgi:ABC transporter transmembrane region
MTLPTRPLPVTAPMPAAPPATSSHRRRSLRAFLKPYRGTLSLASGLTLVEALLDLARPWPLKLAVDNAIGGRPLGGPLAFLNDLGPAGLAAVAALGGIALVGIGALVGYLITYLTSATAERVGADLRESVFGRLLQLGLPFHDRHRSGDLVTRLTGDVADPGRNVRGRTRGRPDPGAGRPGRGPAAGAGGGAAAAADPGGSADLQGRRRRPGRGGHRGAAQRPGRPGVHPRARGRGPVRRAQPQGRAGRAGRHGPGGAVVAGGRSAAGGRGPGWCCGWG